MAKSVPLNPSRPKLTNKIGACFAPVDYARIDQASTRQGLSLAAFVRLAALHVARSGLALRPDPEPVTDTDQGGAA